MPEPPPQPTGWRGADGPLPRWRTTMTPISHQIQLLRRPTGLPAQSDFILKEVPLPALSEGEVQVANQWLSVDPYMRGRMSEAKSYVPPSP